MGTPYTSVKTGLWSDPTVWAQADYPHTAADVVTIAATHVVTYDISSATELGAITVNGTLKASRAMTTLLALGHVDLTISATGELDFGKTGDVIPANFISTINAAPTAPGAGYSALDVLTLIAGDGTATVRVDSVDGGGGVTGVTLLTGGNGYAVATGWVTSGGLGAGCTINITAVASYTATITFNTTVENVKGIQCPVAGGKIYTLDNKYYYGNIGESALQADWTATSVFNVNTDVSKAWKAGDTLLVHRGALYSSQNTDCDLVTIAVGGVGAWDGTKTPITVNEAWARIKYAGGKVINVSRNVILSKLGAVTTIGNYNTLRPTMRMVNTYANPNAEIGGIWTGWYQLYINQHTPITAVIRNANYGVIYGSYHTISGNVYSNSNGVIYGSYHTISGNVYSNSYGICYGSYHTISGNVYSNNYSVYSGSYYTISGNVYSNNYGVISGSYHTISGNVYSNSSGICYGSYHTISGNVYSNSSGVISGSYHTISGNVYSNTYGVYGGVGLKITGKLSYNAADVLAANTSDFAFNWDVTTCINIRCINAKTKNPPTFLNRNNALYYGYITFEHYLQSKNAHYKAHAFADVIRNAVTVRTGGAATSLEVVPLSNLASPVPAVEIFGEWIEDNVPATAQTRTIYILGTGWGGGYPTAAQLWFEVEYFSDATLLTTTILKSTAVISDTVTWFPFTVNFVPAQSGKCIYRCYLQTYQAASKIFVDAALYR